LPVFQASAQKTGFGIAAHCQHRLPATEGLPDNDPMSRRFQFSLRDLFWLVLVISAFLGGMAAQHKIDRQPVYHETMIFRDGSTWVRVADQPKPHAPPSALLEDDADGAAGSVLQNRPTH